MKNIFIKPLFISIAMGGIVYLAYKGLCVLISSTLITMGLSIILGVVVYFILLLSLNILSKEEKASIPILSKIFAKFEKTRKNSN